MNTHVLEYDIVVVGGGTAGPMAAIKAKERDPSLRVLLLEKANVKRSGAISMGMDGLNNAVIPGHATPEQYTREITIANDGIVDQQAVYAYAAHSFATIEQLDRWGVKFEKDGTGDYAVKKVHHMGSYVLPMPEGHDIKKVLYRQLKRARIAITNRIVATRVLTDAHGRASGVLGFDCRSADFHVIRAKAVILCCGAAGRLGLPASGYLMGTYENPTNAGDGYAMAYHAGAALANLECFQINPLIKDYNGPACAYVTGPLGGFTANGKGERFIECDYWSGQMMWEFHQELQSGNGPVFLKLDHLAEETIQTIEQILHTNERPSRGRFHAGRGTDYRHRMVEMHISEIGFCSGHSASGVYVNARAETTVPGLYAAGDMAAVPHNYMLGAFTYGWFAGQKRGRLRRRPRSCARRRRAGRSRTRARVRAARARARPRARAGRIQAAPDGERLSAAAEGHAEDGNRAAALRRHRRRHRIDQGRSSARADARGRGARDPRLRGNGRARVAVSHGKPLGAVPPPRRLSAPRRRAMVLPHMAAQGRRRHDAQREARGRTVHRAARRRRTQRIRPSAHPRTGRARGRSLTRSYTVPHTPHDIFLRSSAPVTIDEERCIADKGCTVCVDVCPLDLLAIDVTKGKAYMQFDECWYCMPCERDCPTGAVKVDIPYLLR